MKKDEIINVARNLFTEYGYKKVSMDEIAREANVTKKTIYTYFKDKEDLFRYFLLEEIQKMEDIINEIKNKNLNVIETVHQTIYELIKYRKNAAFLVRITKEAKQQRNEPLTKCVKIIDEEIQNCIKEQLRYAAKQNYIRKCNIDLTAFIIFRVYLALIYEWEEEYGRKLNEREVSKHISDILTKGLFYKEGENVNE